MSKGYYVVKLVVLHSIEDRKEYLETNPSSIPINRDLAMALYKKMQQPQVVNNVMCGSCGQFHSPGRVYKDKNE